MHLLIISGPPGCGKGTQAKLLAQEFDFVHFSTGEMLRNEINKDTELGELAKSLIENGNFIPDYVAETMVKNFIDNNPNIKGIIFDGFPRTSIQCKDFSQMLETYNEKIDIFLDIFVDKEVLIQRLIDRNEQQNRADDSDIKIIEHRFELYENLTRPIVEFYKNQNIYKQIDGNNTVDAVFEELKQAIIVVRG